MTSFSDWFAAKDDRQKIAIIFLITGAALWVLSGWLWVQYIYRSPENVFWGMVDKSLHTHGVTRRVQEKTASSSVDRYLSVMLGADPFAQAKIVVTQQNSKGKKTTVESEIIASPTVNYSRYKRVESDLNDKRGTKLDFGAIENKWVKEDADNTQSNIFAEAVGVSPGSVAGSVPFAMLPSNLRTELVTYARNHAVYDADLTAVKKGAMDGRATYEYGVKVNVQAYLTLLKRIDEQLGLDQLTRFKPQDYAKTPPIQVVMTIAVDSRQLLEIKDANTGQVERFSAYGARRQVYYPEASLTKKALDNKLEAILAGKSQ